MENKRHTSYTKLQQGLIKKGKKGGAFGTFKGLSKQISLRKLAPLPVLENSIANVEPLFTIKTQKKGKRVLQIPQPILKKDKRILVAFRWLIKYSQKHTKNSFKLNLLTEILDAYKNQGFTKKFQQEFNSLVLQNRSSLKN
jgi:ribosomal protein S7